MTLERFHQGQRVQVLRNEKGIAVNKPGTVWRVHVRDNGASVALDQRHKNAKVHPFPSIDDRGTLVQCYPEDCELPTSTGKDRRRAARAHKTPSAPSIGEFGRDHWSQLLYIECRCTDNAGVPDKRHLRCLDARHPQHSHGHDATDAPTRLRDGKLLPHHDDWDCVDDLAREGLIEILGTGINPIWRMTPDGNHVASLLRMHKQNGGSCWSFVLEAPEATGT